MSESVGKCRIGYLDSMRGIAILLVVFGHLEVFSYGVQSIAGDPFSSFITTFNMPLFFFISGMLADRTTEWWKQRTFVQLIKQKSIQLLVPTAVFYLLYCWFKSRPISFIITDGPSEYWFTIVLFEIFLLYYGIVYVSLRFKEAVRHYALVSAAVLSVILFLIDLKINHMNSCPALQLQNLCRFFSYFVLGVFSHQYSHRFELLLSKDSFRTIILLLFAFLFIAFRCDLFMSIPFLSYLHIPVSFFHFLNYEFLVKYVGLFSVVTLVYHYRDVFEQDLFWCRSLRMIGRYTLDIYMIHYFLLPQLPFLKEFFGNAQSPLLEFIVTSGLALLIVYSSIFISKIIRSSHFLGRFLLAAK